MTRRTGWHLFAAMFLAAATFPRPITAETNEVRVLKDLAYCAHEGASAYEQERCKLDLYVPSSRTHFATLLWFHGGGLKEGDKAQSSNPRLAESLAAQGVAVAMANYRLSPKATYPAYIDDAASSFAWLKTNVTHHGGNPSRLFVGGHSAGAYLALMLSLDGRFLKAHGLDTSAIKGVVPVSGQTMTHYTIREERGLDKNVIIADAAAPIHQVRADAPPMLIMWADNDLPARAEENLYLVAALKAAGHKAVFHQQIANRDHNTIAQKIIETDDPVARAILQFMAAD
jgi:acetyl esterase/lipase